MDGLYKSERYASAFLLPIFSKDCLPTSYIIAEAYVQPIAVPLVFQFLIGFTNQPLFTVSENQVIPPLPHHAT
jgi:hypothetical protein